MTLFTIGFTQTSAERFFSRLIAAGVKSVIDVRLNNVSQLAGFAKKEDLKFFLRAIGGIDYVHLPLLAPTQELLDEHKKRGGAWEDYERRFNELISARAIETQLVRSELDRACLLCSEASALHCHRRLVAEHLAAAWGDVEIAHL